MASTRANPLSPNFILTPQQQNLLFRALTSNQSNNGTPPNNPLSLSPESIKQDHAQQNGSTGDSSVVQESPFLDNYDYSFDADSSFDFDFGNVDGMPKMIGDLPGTSNDTSESKSSTPDNDGAEKRGHEDDEEDDEGENNGAKRRESEGKISKKPGRKPLTSEPTSKRKAQNRAAQRAFRERKEKHLKDLETKVEELEKASHTANNENSQLRSQVEKMTMELNEYKKRLSVLTTTRPSTSISHGNTFGTPIINNLNDVNFQFEFPKFGVLPGPNANKANGVKPTTHSPSFPSPGSVSKSMSTSPEASRKDSASSSNGSNKGQSATDAQTREASTKFSGFFNASSENNYLSNMSRSSLDSGNFSIGPNSTGSPSSSSNGNGGTSSSCGTSPEPATQSPVGFKPLDTMATIGEEPSTLAGGPISQGEATLCEKLAMCCGNVDDPIPGISKLSSKTNETADTNINNLGFVDLNNFDWLAQQNGGQFDPQLFGGYREPQENILSNTTLDDSFFNDAFDVDFTTPFNTAASPAVPKKDLISQIDQKKEEDDTIAPASNGKLLTCNNIWEKLQGCPKVQSSEIDLDQLCSDLQKKAKCSGTGAVVDESDFKLIMTKHLGPPGEDCPSRC